MRRRAALAVLLALIAWSAQDILVWQRVFEANRLWQFNDQYQFWHQAFLVALLALGAWWLRGAWIVWFIAATWTIAYGGLADVLYYWLDGRAVPATLPWLDHGWNQLILFHPATADSLLGSSLIWVAFWLGLMAGALLLRRRQETPALAPNRADVG